VVFRGVLEKEQPPAKVYYRVLGEGKASGSRKPSLRSRGSNLPAKWFVMFMEAFGTLLKTVQPKRKLACSAKSP
jgi:hypothetical protein